MDTSEDFNQEKRALALMQSMKLCGLIITPISDCGQGGYEIEKMLTDLNVPVVLVDRDVKNSAFDGVFINNTQGAFEIDLGFSDFTDAYTMAGYVLSDDVEFAGLSAEEAKAVLEYRSTLTLEQLTEIFNNADFPLASADKWPESFSYEKRGTVCFSLPVPHALGDYVIVTFDRSIDRSILPDETPPEPRPGRVPAVPGPPPAHRPLPASRPQALRPFQLQPLRPFQLQPLQPSRPQPLRPSQLQPSRLQPLQPSRRFQLLPASPARTASRPLRPLPASPVHKASLPRPATVRRASGSSASGPCWYWKPLP